MLERNYQAKVIKKIKDMFPGCIVLKNDANYLQGFPDWLVLYYEDKWAALEIKRDKDANHQPNQDYYVDKLNGMGHAYFIFPENESEVLREIQRAFQS